MDTDTRGNLAHHRAARSVWDKRGWSGLTIEERVGPWLVSAVGAGLVVAGVRQRSWRGAQWMAVGAGLIGCAAAGLCNPHDVLMRWRRVTAEDTDRLTEELMDSFPASDPSSSNTIVVGVAIA